MQQERGYFYTKDNVRLTLSRCSGGKAINWIFIPGGPGADASYLESMGSLLELPGNCWLVDFPGNGTHDAEIDSYDKWMDIFIPTLKLFPNPVLIGHSFGGMLPLLYPECETILKGLVLLSTTPTMWQEEAARRAQELELPDLSKEMGAFIADPTQATFDNAINACMPYYFTKDSFTEGAKLLKQVKMAYKPAVWWQHKVTEISYEAKWIPQNVPTLIVNAEYDAMTPPTLFKKDKRFDRPNISRHIIPNAGHLPYFEQPEEVKTLFEEFMKKIKV